MDFTLSVLRNLLTALCHEGYTFMTVNDFTSRLNPVEGKHLVLRHDVDKKPENSLAVARIESELGIKGTYYFRIFPESLDKEIAGAISSLGHEVGYHYEDIDIVSRKLKVESQKSKVESRKLKVESRKSKAESRKSGAEGEEELVKMAFESFRMNLASLREIVPVDTVCMHGSPLSRHDSRLMWKYFDYRELGIRSEPYFDIPLDEMLFLTDTGRRWDGSEVSVRDRVYNRAEGYYTGWVRKPVTGSAMAMTQRGEAFQKQFRFRRTSEISGTLKANRLPEAIVLTIHPQRWSDNLSAWALELLAQNIKNQIKYLIRRRVRS